jgi:hypothetical protein
MQVLGATPGYLRAKLQSIEISEQSRRTQTAVPDIGRGADRQERALPHTARGEYAAAD